MVSLFLTFFSVPSKRGSSESSGARLALADEQKEKERAGPPEDVASYRKNARVGGTWSTERYCEVCIQEPKEEQKLGQGKAEKPCKSSLDDESQNYQRAHAPNFQWFQSKLLTVS